MGKTTLWNRDDLIAKEININPDDLRPGLTGWAQINGRDELEIDVKAIMENMLNVSLFLFDVKCFFGTITSVLKSDGVVEVRTGSMNGDKK